MKNLNNPTAFFKRPKALPVIDVDGIAFVIQDQFLAARYDGWSFYRNQINKISGAKAIDLIVVARDASIAFLVEVKDFRVDAITREPRTRTKPTALPDEVAAKVLHSLGGILAARTRSVIDDERSIAAAVCKVSRLRVALHLEQASGYRRVFNPADLQVKLRQSLKAVDPHTIVVSRESRLDLPWSF